MARRVENQHHEMHLHPVIRGARETLYDFFVLPGIRKRRYEIDGYISPGYHRRAVTGDFPTVKAAQDWFENATGIRPPRWRKSLNLGKNYGLSQGDVEKNPRSEISLKELKDAARERGMVVRLKDGEYRVAFPKDEAGAYYTNDASDAFYTMKDMHMRAMAKNPRPKFGRKKSKPAKRAKKARGAKRMSTKLRARVGGIAGAAPRRWAICGETVSGKRYFFNGRGFDDVGSHAAYYVQRETAASVARTIGGQLPSAIKSLKVIAL